MLNSGAFLNSFSAIERYLRHTTRSDRQTTFYQLIEQAAKSDRAVRRYEDDLKEFADLRNAIVHERGDGHVIAEPNDLAVKDIRRIETLLTQPPIVASVFQRRVITLSATDPVAKAVAAMLHDNISQIPIGSEQGFSGLLTTNTIARWLGACVPNDLFSLSETPIARVMAYTEDDDNHAFIKRTATLLAALDLFQAYECKGRRLDAILITENGKRTEQLLGIITVADLPRALKEIT